MELEITLFTCFDNSYILTLNHQDEVLKAHLQINIKRISDMTTIETSQAIARDILKIDTQIQESRKKSDPEEEDVKIE